jgi:hypothetical protein
MKTVSIIVSPGHAASVVRALDLFSRVMLGQFNILAELFRSEDLVGRDPLTLTGGRRLTAEEQDRAELLCDELKRLMGFERGASFSIGSNAVSPHAHRAYEVLCVLQKALAVERDPSGTSVHHQGLRIRYTSDPEPMVAIGGEPMARSSDKPEDLNVGDMLKDNDPRKQARPALTITEVLPNGVVAETGDGRRVTLLRNRIHSDGKARRSGYTLFRAKG